MKKFVGTFVLIVSLNCAAKQPWNISEPDYARGYDATRDAGTDFRAAKEKAKKEGKNILLILGGEWCSWCHILNDFLDKNEDVAKRMLTHFVVVKVYVGNRGDESEFVKSLPEFNSVPHFFVFSASGKFIASQDTSLLEEGRGYNSWKFVEFLKRYEYR